MARNAKPLLHRVQLNNYKMYNKFLKTIMLQIGHYEIKWYLVLSKWRSACYTYMNDIRCNVNTVTWLYWSVHGSHHVHDDVVAMSTVLSCWKYHLEVVGVFVDIKEHGPIVTLTSRQLLHRRQWKLPLVNRVSRSRHGMPQTHSLCHASHNRN